MRFLIWLVLGYLGYRIIKSLLASRDLPARGAAKGTEAFQDPVCGTYVAPDDAIIGRYNGERLYFCSEACLEKFREKISSSS